MLTGHRATTLKRQVLEFAITCKALNDPVKAVKIVSHLYIPLRARFLE